MTKLHDYGDAGDLYGVAAELARATAQRAVDYPGIAADYARKHQRALVLAVELGRSIHELLDHDDAWTQCEACSHIRRRLEEVAG